MTIAGRSELVVGHDQYMKDEEGRSKMRFIKCSHYASVVIMLRILDTYILG